MTYRTSRNITDLILLSLGVMFFVFYLKGLGDIYHVLAWICVIGSAIMARLNVLITLAED